MKVLFGASSSADPARTRQISCLAPTLTALLLAACGRGDEDVREEPRASVLEAPAAAPPTAGPEGTDFDYAPEGTPERLLQRLAMSELYQTEASRVALERTQSPQVRNLAQALVAARASIGNEARDVVQAEKLNPILPTVLDRGRQAMINDLRGVTGEQFDRRYLDQQIRAHQEVLDELEAYAEGGTHVALKAWAAQAVPVVRLNLEQARTMDRSGADGTPTPGSEEARGAAAAR